jgi:hypothetical protein
MDDQAVSSPIWRTHLIAFLSLTMVVTLYSTWSSSSSSSSPSSSSPKSALDVIIINPSLPSLSFTLYRPDYDEPLSFFSANSDDSYQTYSIFNDYISIIEPYTDMSPYILDSTDDDDSFFYELEVCPVDSVSGQITQNECQVTQGLVSEISLNIECSPFDVYALKLKQYNDLSDIGSERGEGFGYGLCMYVRRDIRKMTAEHVDKTMNAFYTLWETEESDGQALYGDNYHSIQWFGEAHLFNAGQQDSDHIHEGN